MRNCNNSVFVLIAVLIATPAATSRGAVVLNGSFENGLTGWTMVAGGSASTIGISFGISPTDLANQAFLNNSGASTTDSAIETALGLAAGRLDVLAGGGPPQATLGTAIFQTISGVMAGEQLSFDWSFVTNENFGAPFNQNDFAFWSITNMGNPGAILHRAADPLLPASEGFAFKSAPGRVTYNFTAPGDYVLGFGVMNVIDGGGSSGLVIDNVAVPEPTSLALLSLVSVGCVAYRRRRIR